MSDKNYRKIIIIISILLSIVLLGSVFFNITLNLVNLTATTDWVGFWGNVIGTIAGMLGSFLILIITLTANDKQNEKQNKLSAQLSVKLEDIKHIEAALEENLKFFAGNVIFDLFVNEPDIGNCIKKSIIHVEINKRNFEILKFHYFNDAHFADGIFEAHNKLMILLNDIMVQRFDQRRAFEILKDELFELYKKVSDCSYKIIDKIREGLSRDV